MTKADAKAPPADIRRYLKATGLIELRYIRKLSGLCAQTYYIRKLTVRFCWSSFLQDALLTSAFLGSESPVCSAGLGMFVSALPVLAAGMLAGRPLRRLGLWR